MSSSRRSAVSRTGPRGTTRLYPNVDPQHYQLIRQPNLRANNYPRSQFHQTNVPNRNEFADRNAALPMRQFLMPPSAPGPSAPPHIVTKLDRFLHSVTPVVPAPKLSERGVPYYFLEDLWEAFQEWSAYGAGVPYILNDGKEVTQYYVPYLSGMQIYIDPRKPPVIIGGQAEGKDVQSHGPDQQTSLAGSFASLNLNNQKLKQVVSSDNITEVCGPCGMLAYEYMEHERPHLREPLSLKVSLLASGFPNLRKYRSCDLLPSSWIAVAWYSFYLEVVKWAGRVVWVPGETSWVDRTRYDYKMYPIYRIPAGAMLEELDASFLTLHSLSTQHGSFNDPMLENDMVKLRLPAIGVVPYKLKGSKISPCGPYECGQEDALFRSACNWLSSLRACLPDHNFFFRRH